ncbi:MAG: von Willebrand factor type A domain-containing protein [Christensenellaceae bacterium]|nr:von Willebrand factor type A domain-containing protein [Christensenellaceae bacterium]
MMIVRKRRLIAAVSLTLALLIALTGVAVAQSEGRELREGDSGDDVRAVQLRLAQLGYLEGEANGVFGPETTAALVAFQREHDLLASGILDDFTRRALFSEDARPYDATITSDLAEAMTGAAPLAAMYDGAMPGALLPIDYNTNEYNAFRENRFLSTRTSALSTFAADVDTASYAQLRRKLLAGEQVPVEGVRIEEMFNYFRYDYRLPEAGEALGVTMELAGCPWNAETQLLLIGLRAAEIPKETRPAQNLTFLIDVSGSMDAPDKLPLVKRAFQLLLDELAPTDTVSIVTYASQDEVVLQGARASEKPRIMEAIDGLTAGGMTAGAAGIQTAYELAERYKLPDGNNRILLATDGDLNVGVSDEGALARLVEEKKRGGVFLSVLGFGDGNYKDNKLEALADRGDGNYHYIDTVHEARRALVTEIGATFFTVAKDVKLQLDFNPAAVKGYRLIGYENRLMAAEDFADDAKDGGELGSGHRVTALYELVPAESAFDIGEASSKYQDAPATEGDGSELLTLSIRAKPPQGDESRLWTYPLKREAAAPMGENLRFAAAVADVGMLMRDSEWKGGATYASALELLRGCEGITGDAYKEEFLYLVTLLERAESLN